MIANYLANCLNNHGSVSQHHHSCDRTTELSESPANNCCTSQVNSGQCWEEAFLATSPRATPCSDAAATNRLLLPTAGTLPPSTCCCISTLACHSQPRVWREHRYLLTTSTPCLLSDNGKAVSTQEEASCHHSNAGERHQHQ